MRKGKLYYMRMRKQGEAETVSPAAALALLRWSKATPEQKAEQARKMVAGRRKAARKRARGGK